MTTKGINRISNVNSIFVADVLYKILYSYAITISFTVIYISWASLQNFVHIVCKRFCSKFQFYVIHSISLRILCVSKSLLKVFAKLDVR